MGLTVLGALMSAAAVHLASVLAIPRLADHDAYRRVAALTGGVPLKTAVTEPDTANGSFPYRDPAVVAGFCLYDLGRSPVRVVLDVAEADFAGLSVHGRYGRVPYGLTNRSASNGTIAVVLMTPLQFEQARARDGDDPSVADLRVSVPDPEGFVEAQVLAIEPSAGATARAVARTLSCTAEPAGAGGTPVRP